MLVLSRKVGEKVMIEVPPSDTPTRIEVTVVDWSNRVRLGFEAPREVKIFREELLTEEKG